MSTEEQTHKPAVIFDLDGTLADTLEDIADAINEVFTCIGQPQVTRQRIRALIGHGLIELLQKSSGIDDLKHLADLTETYRSIYTERMLRTTRLYPGIEAVLDALTISSIPMCVLSNKPHEYTAPMCDGLLDRWPFVRVQGCTDEGTRKPNPIVALELAEQMKRPPSDVYFVGDSSTDLLTARNAGMIPVAVTWGYRDREELETANPTFYVDQPRQLIDLVTGNAA